MSFEREDGVLVYPDARDLPLGTLVQDRFLTWELVDYDGHVSRVEPWGETTFNRAPPRTDRERLLDLHRIDRVGRVWEVASVDEAGWAKRIAEYDARWPEEVDVETRTRGPVVEPQEVVGESVTWTPTSWQHFNCTGSWWVKENHVWEGEGRTPIGSSHTRQERPAVTVLTPGGSCSGTMVDGDEVLTAAHCLVDCNGQTWPKENVQICVDASSGGPTCYGGQGTQIVNYLTVQPVYTGGSTSCGGTDFADDWGIVTLDVPLFGDLVPQDWTMPLSQAGNSTLSALTTQRMFGIDAWRAPGCTSTGLAMQRNVEHEPIAAIFNKSLRWKVDNSPGSSGRPYYYCPAGDDNLCLGNETPFAIGVQAGWNSVINRAVGPKVRFFRSIALAVMDND